MVSRQFSSDRFKLLRFKICSELWDRQIKFPRHIVDYRIIVFRLADVDQERFVPDPSDGCLNKPLTNWV